MAGYHSPQLDVAVRLNTNESPYPPPPAFARALAAAVGEVAWNRYPDRRALALRAAIGALHGLDAEQVFVANGSNEVLQALLLAYGGPGRRAALFEPTYALHGHLARVTGTEVVVGDRRDDFTVAPDELERVVEGASPTVTFLCSPNNPTGTAEDPGLVATAVDLAARTGGLVCVDEAYAQFAEHRADGLVDDDVPLVVSRTYSKTWALAAARIGYLLAPRWVVVELEKVALPYHLDAVTQLAGRLALDHLDAMEERVGLIVAERRRIEAALDALPVRVWPSSANFVLFRPTTRSGDDVWHALVERSVLVRNCSSWPRLEGCLRVTVGTPDENTRFLDALAEVLAAGTDTDPSPEVAS
ncbi:MAG: histidinol-phosphate transaminase [Actinomyces sp.]|nr:MAG: histidinol-phosphate transaminase [Actinomyces sp.]